MTEARPPATSSEASAELAFLLERAGIALPPERMAEVAAEYESFRQQLALVNGAWTAEDEPALIFVAGMQARPE